MALVPVFVEVVRQGSFTKAAAALELPKSTVSRRVARLEQELGVPLLVRTTRKIRLTEEGAAFHGRVAPALERVDEAARAILEQQEEPRGHLRISVPPDVRELGPLVARFVEDHPEVTVEVSASGKKVDLVGEGFDLAIRAGRLADSSLIARRLFRVRFQLFAARSYLDEHGVPQRVEDLAAHRCVLFRPQHGVNRWNLHGPDGEERTVEVRGPVATDDLLFLSHAVRAGAGVGLLPRYVLGSSVPAYAGELERADARDVCRVLDGWSTSGGDVHIVYPGTPFLPAKVRAFRDYLVRELPGAIEDR